jgi:hypothetical protein
VSVGQRLSLNEEVEKQVPAEYYLVTAAHELRRINISMITEARKFGIATTIAHQERYGQLSEDKKIQDATVAAANRIFFQVTVIDSQELAPEFADPPTTSH